ncbi:hypothetical protein ACQP1P_41955 [Dactylosporangium sp. CA-052675]|uniref:hypothetical protein n=1 Tax=Dactylosporangium sp. CA-052675 TaxID=3239927 RepID=UPI003D8D5F99
MDTKAIASQFKQEPGRAFLEIIKASPEPIGAQNIKRPLIEAGAKKADVDRLWSRLQPMIKLHPQIRMEKNRYGWLAHRSSAQESLDVLAGNVLAKVPQWLVRSLVENVAGALAKASATGTGSADREFEDARLVAELAVAVESLQTRGDTIAEVIKLFSEETRRKRLWPLGQPGETVPFDPDAHEAEVQPPAQGANVRVVRSGYIWRGGGEPIVAAKAVVVA